MPTMDEIKLKTIEKISPYAIDSQRKTGIPASVTIAQFIQESGWTLSALASKFNNFFGVKSDGDPNHTTWQTTTEFENGKYVSKVEPFKVYRNAGDSFLDHANVLAGLGITGGDPFQIADKLQANGYATDPNYAQSLKNLITENNLTRFDKANPDGNNDQILDISGGTSYVVGGNGEIRVQTPDEIDSDPTVTTIGEIKGDVGSIAKKFTPTNATYIGMIILIVLVIALGLFVTIKDA